MMKVLIDSSAWIEFLRRTGEPELKAQVADILGTGRAVFTCPIAFELRAGARKSEVRALDEALSFAERIELTPRHWDLAAKHAATLRAKGITVPASDLLIATVAADSGVALLARDQHFEMIRKATLSGLRLV
ncbi:MAG: PIN domain-containing protein [Opitutaceae bacterium]|jgi:predicted nucleic acid-binding protein|nr:PIN domain-containing protein [Opitutaceae bacterium]